MTKRLTVDVGGTFTDVVVSDRVGEVTATRDSTVVGSPQPAARLAPDIQLSPLDTTNLRDQARRSIRASIIAGEVEAGRVHPVSYLASQLHVSATPIREALFDRDFHTRLVAGCGNGRLVRIVIDMGDQAGLYGLRARAESGKLVESAGIHLELLAAVLAGGSEQADKLMSHHLKHTRGIWASRP